MTIFYFRLFPGKNKESFFQKNLAILSRLCPIWGNTECSSKFCCYYSFFFLILAKCHYVKFQRKAMSGLQATVVSDARMHTYMVQTYHETLHNNPNNP